MKIVLGNEEADRRGFIRKILKLGAMAGIASILAGQVAGKTVLPQVKGLSSPPVLLDSLNSGSATTTIQSDTTNSASLAAFNATATAQTGNTTGVQGASDSPNGFGVVGYGHGVGVLGTSTGQNGVGVQANSQEPGVKPFVAKGAKGQAANLQEWQDDTGKALSSVDANGNINAPTLGTSQIKFANGYQLVESLRKDGTAAMDLLNPKGAVIAIFDENGNLHLKATSKVLNDL